MWGWWPLRAKVVNCPSPASSPSFLIIFPLTSYFHLSIRLSSPTPSVFSPLFLPLLSHLSPLFFLLFSISPSLALSCIALAVSSASQDRHREMLFYMLLNTQVACTEVCLHLCVCVCVFSCLFLLCSFHPSAMSALLQTPPHSQCSELCCTDNPPVGAFVCVFREVCLCL